MPDGFRTTLQFAYRDRERRVHAQIPETATLHCISATLDVSEDGDRPGFELKYET